MLSWKINLRTTLGYQKRSNFILSKVGDFQYYWKDNPRPTFSTITDYAPPGLPMSCTFLNNSSAVKFKFLKYIREAVKMYSVHSYAHWYNEFMYNTPDKKDLGSVLVTLFFVYIQFLHYRYLFVVKTGNL